MSNKIKAIAIHLPQFHPTPENDEWWGKGFTEWTNVTKAEPLFEGHYQPHLPADLGFYDLRLNEARLAQEALAKAYGLYGFCFYHYWFKGKRLLHEPIDRKLKNPDENFPFMLCWANETWSRRWLGEEKEILLKQEYSVDDDYAHAHWLYDNAFNDDRYIKIYGKPAFAIYRPMDLPDFKKTIAIFKEVATLKGMQEPYFIASNSHEGNFEGFNHVMNFEPKLGLLQHSMVDRPSKTKLLSNIKKGILSPSLKVYEYADFKNKIANKKFDYPVLPCVFVGWDNTARRGKNGIIIKNQNKNDFKKSLEAAKEEVKNYADEEKIVFINAWNEWAEGNHLEPDRKFGHQFLEAVKEVFGE